MCFPASMNSAILFREGIFEANVPTRTLVAHSPNVSSLGRGVCVGNGVNVAKLSTDKIEKCLAPQPGLEPRTTRFPLCAPKLQIQCATHAATEPMINS